MKVAKQNPVQGFVFETVTGSEYEDRNDTVCQIRRRTEGDETLQFGPAFEVEFGDGEKIVAYSSELRPWYQTD